MSILDARVAQPLTGGASFSFTNRMTRLAFLICWFVLARWTPRQANPLRVAILKLFGARIGTGAVIYGSARIWLPVHLEMGAGSTLGPGVECYSMAPIRLGAGAIVSQRAHLCAGSHDHRDPAFQLIARPIVIGDRAWIAAEAFVGPGVTVGEGAVLAARGCAFHDLDPWTVYSGNPALATASRELRLDAVARSATL